MEQTIGTSYTFASLENQSVRPLELGRESSWRSLYRIGGIASLVMLCLIPVQIVLYVIYPPPTTVEGFFTLLRNDPLIGLVSLDLFLMVSVVLAAIMMLSVCVALRRSNPSLTAIALFLVVLSTAIYFASSVAFDMLRLSHQYAAATSDARRMMLLAAGEGMLATYQGTAFDVYYVLSGIAALLMSVVMLRGGRFSRRTAQVGIVMSVMMMLPPTIGTLGLVFAFASLVPTAIWLAMVARTLLGMSWEEDREPELTDRMASGQRGAPFEREHPVVS